MKKVLLFIIVIMILVCGTSCMKEEQHNVSNDYVFETDHQWNSETYATLTFFADTPRGLYIVKDDMLYTISENQQMEIFCSRAQCSHGIDGFNPQMCDAYIGMGCRGIEYYNNSLYIVAFNDDMELAISEYKLTGEYVREISTVPNSLQYIIQHRGMFYYSYYEEPENSNSWGKSVVACMSTNGKDNKVIYVSEYDNGQLSNMFAYGKQVYIRELDLDNIASDSVRTQIFDIETGGLLQLNGVVDPEIYNGKLLYYNYDDDMATDAELHSAELNGEKSDDIEVVLNYPEGLLCAFDKYIITHNVKDFGVVGDYRQKFTVYKDQKIMFEFSLEDVEGVDLSKSMASDFVITERNIFVLVVDNAHTYIVSINRKDLELGMVNASLLTTY